MDRYTQQGALSSIYITAKDGSAYHFMQGSDLYPAINKLAHYEDLEEQGRLIEQKHGTWEESGNFDDCFWICSNCKFPSEATAAPIIYNYCPNCGAKMMAEIPLKELEE